MDLKEESLHTQIFQRLVHKESRPEDALEDTDYAHPEGGGVREVIEPGAD